MAEQGLLEREGAVGTAGVVHAGTAGTTVAGPRDGRHDPWSDGPGDGRTGLGPGVTCVTCARYATEPSTYGVVTSPEAAADVLAPRFAGADRERCEVALLDTKHRVRALVTTSIGSLDRTFMAPRELLRDALLANAAAIVVAHNHPSGDPEPSADDRRVTTRLVRAGGLIGIDVLDHLVIAGDRWVSLARRGHL